MRVDVIAVASGHVVLIEGTEYTPEQAAAIESRVGAAARIARDRNLEERKLPLTERVSLYLARLQDPALGATVDMISDALVQPFEQVERALQALVRTGRAEVYGDIYTRRSPS